MPRPETVLLILLAASAYAPAGERWGVPGQLPVNLVPFFNNDGISSEKSQSDGNFDCADHAAHIPGSTFPAEALPDSGARCSVLSAQQKLSFLFPTKQDGMDNNVACSGQVIETPPAFYSALYVLGASENGSQEADLELGYEEASARRRLRLTDWCQDANYGEIAAFRSPHRFTWDPREQSMGKEEIKCQLWVQKVELDEMETLLSIRLSYNRRMHVFCMTLTHEDDEEECRQYAEDTAILYQELASKQPLSYDSLFEGMAVIDAKLQELARQRAEQFPRQIRWLELLTDYYRRRLPDKRYRITPSQVRALESTQLSLIQDLTSLAKGTDPFASKRGTFLKAHYSDLDGSLQPYSLSVPEEYSNQRQWRLMVNLHGHGWYAPFQGHPAPKTSGVIVLSPHGRGSMDYMFVGELDVLAAIEDVRKDYAIDPNGLYLMGHSMGGTGSWHLSVHYPDRFAAIAPVAGNADYLVWEQVWKKKRKEHAPAFAPLIKFLRDMLNPATYACNLLNVPVFCVHGAKDQVVPVGHARSMTAKVKEAGGKVEYREIASAGHGVGGSVHGERHKWIMKQLRDPAPKVVRYKTARLRHRGAYWVSIERFREWLKFAEVRAEAKSRGRLFVETQNVANFTLHIDRSPASGSRKLRVVVDEQEAYDGPKPASGKLQLARAERGWQVGAPPSGLVKKAGLEGPIEDVFLSSFLIVYGTIAESAKERQVAKAEAEAFVRDWQRLYTVPCRIKADHEVTEDDIRAHSLVLYGAAHANSITALLSDLLPIAVDNARVTIGAKTFEGPNLGVKYCYPNPLNPARYVALFAGTTWQGLFQINNRFGNWFDWGPYDNRSWFDYGIFDDKTWSPETFLCVGFFDQDWQVSDKYQWVGDAEWRARSVTRHVPADARVPRGKRAMYLSDLLPVLIDQHKGPVNFNRSFEGRPLRVGTTVYEKGLGVKAPSVVEFDIGKRFTTFKAKAGIDLEGETKVSTARARDEWLQFLVWGDGVRLHSSEWLQWNSEPAAIDVSIKGVERLKLEIRGSNPRWLFGSAAWAEARVER